jgi:WD40 repeat protein
MNTKLLPRLRVLEIVTRQALDPVWLAGLKQSPARHLRLHAKGGNGWREAMSGLPIDALDLIDGDSTTTVTRSTPMTPVVASAPEPRTKSYQTVAWTDEGWWLAEDRRVVLLDPKTRAELRSHHINEARMGAFSGDGKIFVGHSNLHHVYSLATGAVVHKFGVQAWPKDLRLSRDGRFVLCGCEYHAFLYDTVAKEVVRSIKSRIYYCADIAPDGSRFAVPVEDNRQYDLHIFEPKPRSRAVKLKIPGGDPRFLPDGRLACTHGSALSIHDVQTGERVARIDNPDPLSTLEPSPDGKYVAGVTSNDLVLFDLRAGKIAWKIADTVWGEAPFAFSPDSARIVVATATPRVIDIARGKIV